jgi:hypothetical protein
MNDENTDLGIEFIDNSIDVSSTPTQNADDIQPETEKEVVIGSLLFEHDGYLPARRRGRCRSSSIL